MERKLVIFEDIYLGVFFAGAAGRGPAAPGEPDARSCPYIPACVAIGFRALEAGQVALRAGIRRCVTLLARSDRSVQELVDGYHSIHAVNVATHPRSDLSELNYALQVEHFIAEACLICLSPVYEETRKHHLAEKAAMYYRMARTCAAINHDEERPCLSAAENLLAQEIQDQYKILGGFLDQQ